MGRKPRIEYAGAIYHVMCRGNRREEIFRDDQDRRVFLETLADVCDRTGWIVCAYVLMPNHYHLVLETPEANLVSGMKWFQGTYTKRHSLRHRERGHLFQGRYKSIVIDPEDSTYFQTACDYVHLNPARAGLAGAVGVGEFVWSSSWYLSQSCAKAPSWLALGRIVEAHTHQRDSSRARILYLRYLENQSAAEVDEGEYKALRRGWCLGSADFKMELRDGLNTQLNPLSRDSIIGEPRRMHDECEAEKLLVEAAGMVDLDLSQKESLKKNDIRKEMLAWFLTKKTSVGQAWISKHLGMGNRINVSRAIKHIESLNEGAVEKWKEMFKCLH